MVYCIYSIFTVNDCVGLFLLILCIPVTQMKGYDYAILDSYVEFIQRASTACGINVSGRIPLPTKIRKYTVLKSPHVHKTHRAQFETRTRRRLLHVCFLKMCNPAMVCGCLHIACRRYSAFPIELSDCSKTVMVCQ